MRPRRQEQVAEVDEVPVRLHIEKLDEGGYVATSPDVPGLVAEGRSVTETVEIAQGLARKIIESCLEHGDPLPPAFLSPAALLASLWCPSGSANEPPGGIQVSRGSPQTPRLWIRLRPSRPG